MANHLIIVAGGTGTRMQGHVPKQFLELNGEPVLVHTLRSFMLFDERMNVVVVMHPNFVDYWKELAETLGFNLPHQVVSGGEERFHSVLAGLKAITDQEGVVGIHDAVRPLVSQRTIRNAYEMAATTGAAIPVVGLQESLREVKGESNTAVNRSAFRLVQTPQCFRMEVLRNAFNQAYRAEFTDDASVVESAGYPIQLVEGNRENIKLTTPGDMIMARGLLNADVLK